MANRSSFNYVLPREDARILAGSKITDTKLEREIRKLFIQAHAHYKKVKNGAIRRADVGVARGTDQDDGDPSVT